MLPSRNKKITKAYQNLFLDDTGNLTLNAQIFFDDLYKFTKLFENSPAEYLQIVEGSRSTVRHILKRISSEAREAARQRTRQVTGEDIYE